MGAKKTMDKFVDSPWFLRVTALVLALILFFSVRAEDDATDRPSVGNASDIIPNVPVEVYYDTDNLYVTGVPETVDISIEGPANIVQSTKLKHDFTVSVDLTRLPLGEHEVALQHENLSEKLKVKIKPSKVKVQIEEKITRDFTVETEFNEQMLAPHYVVKSLTASPKTVQITGPRSVIESVHKVAAAVRPVKEVNASYEEVVAVRVLDRELNKLELQSHPSEVRVSVEIEQLSKEVPFRLNETGEVKEGITIDSVVPLTKTVRIYGAQEVLNSIESIVADFDRSLVTGSGVYEVAIPKPKNITSMNVEKAKVQIRAAGDPLEEEPKQEEEENSQQDGKTEEKPIEVEENENDTDISSKPSEPEKPKPEETIETRNFPSIPITVLNVPSHFKATSLQPHLITVTATGERGMLDRLRSTDFTATVNVGAIQSPGRYPFALHVEGPANVKWKASNTEVLIQLDETQ